MADFTQALAAKVFDATPVRLTELGAQWLRLEEEGLDTAATEDALFDLLAGVEKAATVEVALDRDTVLGYLMETYGLLAVGTDPLLRPLLPPISSGGVRVVRRVLGLNGAALRLNNALVGLGAQLVAYTDVPQFNTDLSPGDTAGAVTFNGVTGSVFSLNMPIADSDDGPVTMFLSAGGVQVGRVDFPLTAVGAPFRLSMGEELYYSTFQGSADQATPNTIILDTP